MEERAMTVKDLRAALEMYPDDVEVIAQHRTKGPSRYVVGDAEGTKDTVGVVDRAILVLGHKVR